MNEVTSPTAKSGQCKKPDPENDIGFQVILEDIFMVEQTIERRTPYVTLSVAAAVICIEQFYFLYRYLGQCILQLDNMLALPFCISC